MFDNIITPDEILVDDKKIRLEYGEHQGRRWAVQVRNTSTVVIVTDSSVWKVMYKHDNINSITFEDDTSVEQLLTHASRVLRQTAAMIRYYDATVSMLESAGRYTTASNVSKWTREQTVSAHLWAAGHIGIPEHVAELPENPIGSLVSGTMH